MSKLDTWIDNKVVQNLFVWFFLFLLLLSTIQDENRVLTSFFAILLLSPSVYINNLFILPFLGKNRTVFFSLFIVNTLLFSVISVLLIKSVTEQVFETKMFINFLGVMILSLVFASAIKIARDSFIRRQKEKEAELKLLKAQLNPHFLFNTLNNLYGLSVVKSDKLPNLMLKLSDLLRYSLYDTKEAFVSIEKEIQYIENYMSLEKIRLEDKAEIVLIKEGNVGLKKIAPMLLIVFVENAFKHLGKLSNEKSNVEVQIHVKENMLEFFCINTINKIPNSEPDLEKGKSGIGLQNAKKRLALMYPEKHTLTFKEKNEKYIVNLKLNF